MEALDVLYDRPILSIPAMGSAALLDQRSKGFCCFTQNAKLTPRGSKDGQGREVRVHLLASQKNTQETAFLTSQSCYQSHSHMQWWFSSNIRLQLLEECSGTFQDINENLNLSQHRQTSKTK